MITCSDHQAAARNCWTTSCFYCLSNYGMVHTATSMFRAARSSSTLELGCGRLRRFFQNVNRFLQSIPLAWGSSSFAAQTSGSKDGEDARGHDVALGLPLSSMGLMGKLAYGIVVSRRWLLRAIVLKPSSHAHITTPKTSRWQNVTATILLMACSHGLSAN